MTTIRVAATVSACRECQHRVYSSGGRHDCRKVQAPISDEQGIPQWCPLPPYPAQLAAQALAAVTDAKRVIQVAMDGSADASPERLRDLIRIAAEQLSRVE